MIKFIALSALVFANVATAAPIYDKIWHVKDTGDKVSAWRSPEDILWVSSYSHQPTTNTRFVFTCNKKTGKLDVNIYTDQRHVATQKELHSDIHLLSDPEEYDHFSHNADLKMITSTGGLGGDILYHQMLYPHELFNLSSKSTYVYIRSNNIQYKLNTTGFDSVAKHFVACH